MNLGRESHNEIQGLIRVPFDIIIVQGAWSLYVLLKWSSIQTKAAEQYLSLVQDPVDQKVDHVVKWINLYAVDSAIGFPNTYPVDSDLSGG